MRKFRVWESIGFVLLGSLSYLPLWLAVPYRPDVHRYLLASIPALLFFGAAIWIVRRRKIGLGWLLLLALALRVGFIVQPPSLSEDLYRYLWDGLLIDQGISPYELPPEALDQVQQQHPQLYSRMAHRDRTSIYPPAAQFFFWLSARFGGESTLPWKLLLLAAESLLVYLWVWRFSVSTENLALWLLHPLVILEFFSSGHLDLLALAALGWALFHCWKGHGSRVGWFSAAATLIKIVPAFTFPLLVVSLPRRARFWAATAGMGGGLAALFLGFWLLGNPIESGRSFLSILATYHDSWQFNSLPFHHWPFRMIGGRVVTAVLIITAVSIALRSRRSGLFELFSRYYFLMLIWSLLTPTLHPWYLGWLLLSLPILGLRYQCGLYLSLAAPLSYLAYGFVPPGDRTWVLWLEFGPAYWFFYRDLRAYYDGALWRGSGTI